MSLSLHPRHVSRYVEIARLLWRHRAALGLRFSEHPAGTEDLESELPADGPASLSADLEAMGPTFVKLGQMLSTRPDLVSEPYAHALARLQDRLRTTARGAGMRSTRWSIPGFPRHCRS